MPINIQDYQDIFEPFQRLIDIEICGKTYQVPENNQLLRCFQYLNINEISLGDFCWNGDCANCQVWIEENGKKKPVLTCRTKVSENMKILQIADEIKL
jgi:NADH dehydrogenase/NADH:ubiquinone oxidoreductase subunit G